MIRWAVVGTSFISDTMVRAIQASPGSDVAVVIGRDEGRLSEFRERHGITHQSTSLQRALDDHDVDAVYVGTPNHVHHNATVIAARAGKAILSEKSLAVSMAQTDELLAAVRDRVFFVEGLMYLAHPIIQRFVEVLTDTRLGRLVHINASYAANIAHLVNPEGRGAIYNLGCYPASLLQLVVDTLGASTFAQREMHATGIISPIDENVSEAAAVVRFESGILATIHTAETYGNISNFEVLGTNGRFRFLSNPWLPQRGVNRFSWVGYDGSTEEFDVDDPLDAFDHQVRMVERNVGAQRLEAQRPSPRLDDSEALMVFLTQWESLIRDRATH